MLSTHLAATNTVPLLKRISDGATAAFRVDQNPDVFVLNIADAGNRALLPEGKWVFVEAESGARLMPSDALLQNIEDLTRSFFFHKNDQLYSIRFYVPQEDESEPCLMAEVRFYRADDHPRRDRSAVSFAKGCMNAWYKLCCAFSHHTGQRVLLMTENGESLGGNLAAIGRRLHERRLDERFELAISARNIFNGRQSIGQWLHILRLIARQDYIFVEDYVPIFAAIHLSPQTKLIQVWHAGFGFKLVGFGRFGIDGSPNPFASCHRKYTYALVGNAALRDVYTEVFGIERQALLATGMPRLDHFLESDVRSAAVRAFAEEFPAAQGKRVILFAPTYRGNDQSSAHYDYARIDFAALHAFCERTGSVVIFKMHRFIQQEVPIPEDCRDTLWQAHGDLNDYLYNADALITDYSSCFYDYLLLKRPVLFYAYDESYYMATRGVHRRLGDIVPGPVCHTFEQLIRALEETGDPAYTMPKIPALLVDDCSKHDGLASDKVIDYVLLHEEVPILCTD